MRACSPERVRLRWQWFTKPRMLLAGILLLGAVFRLRDLGLARLTYDNAYPAYDALRTLDGKSLVRVGQPSSTFLDNPPLMGYLQALPLLIWRSPWSVYLFITALNSLAILFVYACGDRILGMTVGLLAALLFAVNPWIVFFSRTTWVQALLPLLTAVIACGLWPSLITPRDAPSEVLTGMLGLTAMSQMYVQAWGALAQVVPLLALFRRRLSRRALLVGTLVFLLATATYTLGVSSAWAENRPKLERFFSGSGPDVSGAGLEHAVRLVTGRDFEVAHAQAPTADYAARRWLSLAVDWFLRLALLAGLGRTLRGLRRPGRERSIATVLLTWMGVPILMTSVSSQPVHIHYLLLTCPAGHVMAAWGIAPLLHHRRSRVLTLVALAAIAIVFGLNLQRANEFVARTPSPTPFDGWPVEVSAQVGATVRQLTLGQASPVRLCAEAHPALLSSMAARLVETERDLNVPELTLLPGREPLLYVLVNSTAPLGLFGPLAEVFPQADLKLSDGTRVSFVRVQPYSHQAALELPDTQLDAPSEAGLTLLGYSLSEPLQADQPLVCKTYWRAEQLLPGRESWFVGPFYHLLDADGQIAANVSGRGRWGYQWRQDDVYVDSVSVPVPADLESGQCRLVIGLFDTIHNVRYPLLSTAAPSGVVEITLQPDIE